MRILFVLPAPVRIPMGGAAVVYRHAGGLVRRGHQVTVAAPRPVPTLRGWGIRAAIWARDRLHGVAREPFFSAPGVQTVEPSSPSSLSGEGYDAVIATGHQTASWVHRLTQNRSPHGYYFIQHDERHLTHGAESTWHLPLRRIAVAGWIADVLDAHGAPTVGVVPNAVDPADFVVDRPLGDRQRRVVALYHRLPVKGPDTLVEALDALRRLDPDVGADVVSARPPSHRLPTWVDVHVRPEPARLRALYNRAAICLHTSRLEGWGLVPMEAAACGCAVVATASRGVAEFLVPDRSMREVPVGDAEALARETAALLADPSARADLAAAAVRDVARFSWEASTDRFEALIRGDLVP